MDDNADGPAARIARLARRGGLKVGVAESVTAGGIATALAAAEGAADWFAGSVVAYTSEVKFSVLGLDRGPVIAAPAAEQMAVGAASLLQADVAVSATGAGGPGPTEGRPPGTVFIAVVAGGARRVREYHFTGDPGDVVRSATVQALCDLAGHCERAVGAVPH